VVYWAPLPLQYDLNRVSEAGTIEGIIAPAQRNLQFTPYVLARARRGGELDGSETDGEFGFDIKYSVTPSLTLDVTYNTDFAQVEADDQQVNLDRFNLFLPEKRPFFLENAGQFTVGNSQQVELFFSRRIGIGADGEVIPIDGGVRLSGKIGSRTNVGFMYMASEAVEGIAPGNKFTVARVNQELANRSSIGAIFIDRNGDGSYLIAEPDDKNRTYGIDGRLGIGENTLILGWAAKTDTPGLKGKDHAFSLKAEYDSSKWFNSLEYTELRRPAFCTWIRTGSGRQEWNFIPVLMSSGTESKSHSISSTGLPFNPEPTMKPRWRCHSKPTSLRRYRWMFIQPSVASSAGIASLFRQP
jgi:hypothetical protein